MTETDQSRSLKMQGNQNASKNKLFYDRIKIHLIQNPKKLEKIVEKLVASAMDGEPWAVKELMDRVDGKPVQATSFENPDGSPIVGSIQVTFIKPNEPTDSNQSS